MPYIAALACALFAVALAGEYLLLTRHFRKVALAKENYIGAFYCQLALELVSDEGIASPHDPDSPLAPAYVRPWLQKRLLMHLTGYAAYVQQSPKRCHLGEINGLAKFLQEQLDAEGEKDAATEDAIRTLKAALRAWAEAHPEEARQLRYGRALEGIGLSGLGSA
jgi:hypothetical protein